MGKGRKKETYALQKKFVPPPTVNGSVTARNLHKSKLAGVIFGCKNHTFDVCFANQTFGLPAPHFSYIRNIDPGLPLFLFNYSDRTLHGIFEATSHGQLKMDSELWTDDRKTTTPYPAQVRFKVRLECQPLLEDQFQPVIVCNYFDEKHFWFELDCDQTSKLISLFSSSVVKGNKSFQKNARNFKNLVNVKGQHKKAVTGISNGDESNWDGWESLSYPDFTIERARLEALADDVGKDGEKGITCSKPSAPLSYSAALKAASTSFDNNQSYTYTSSSPKPWSFLFENEKACNVTRESESFAAHEQNLSLSNNEQRNECLEAPRIPMVDSHVNLRNSKEVDTTDFNSSCISHLLDGERWPSDACVDKDASPIQENECPFNRSEASALLCSAMPELMPTEGNIKSHLAEAMLSNMSCSDLHSMVKKVLLTVEQMQSLQSIQAQKIDSLQQQLTVSRMEIRKLKDQSKMCKPVRSHHKLENESSELDEFKLINDIYPSTEDVIFIAGGYDGSSWLSDLNAYYPSFDLMKPLGSLMPIRAYAAAAKLNNELYFLGGGDSKLWYDSVDAYNSVSDRWNSCPCLSRRKGGLATISLYDKIFAIGGGNGVECFEDVEMLDVAAGWWIPLPPMLYKRFAPAAAELDGTLYVAGGYDGTNYLNSVERFDPRENTWKKLQNMNSIRGCHCLLVLKEKLYALGGYDGRRIVSTMEVFDPRVGSWIMSDPMKSTRGYFGSVVQGDSIYALGGLEDNGEISETVEQYREGQGWEVTNLTAVGKRCYFSAVT